MEKLKKLPIWVDWKYEKKTGKGGTEQKPTKLPLNPRTGGNAQSNNPETWTEYNYAVARCQAAKYAGIGLMFADGVCGIDIDYDENDPEFENRAQTIINLMDAYTEKSPSGKGYHIIFKCDMAKIPQMTVKDKDDEGKEIEKQKLDGKYYYKNSSIGVEFYPSGLTTRFFTFTGDSINDKPVEDRTEQALIFLDNYMLKRNFTEKKAEPPRADQPPPLDILEKARNAKNGVKFCALFDRGDISAYPSHSEADQALCDLLAFWLQGDFNEIDRYFRQSALYRDDKWERTDYRTNTINEAVNSRRGIYYKSPGRPRTKKNAPGADESTEKIENFYGIVDDEKLTIAGVAHHLENLKVNIRYNETTRKTNITGYEKHNDNYITDNLPIIMYDQLNLIYKRCSVNIVQDFLKVITMNNAYNPVLELIEAGKWDGKDRLPELFRIMRINDDDKLSKVLITKWLWQNLSMLRNNKGDFGADGLLVLRGDQGIGKTTFARKMALNNDWFGEGIILDVRNKDSIISAVSVWIGELGEIESTFKSDINALKGFISNRTDKYRVPYGRTYEDFPRRTSFIGTCNSNEYLIDETGNRRYWTVPVPEKMDLTALQDFDAYQLYLQIDERAKKKIQGFRLTAEENILLSERNTKHEKLIQAEYEIRDILFRAELSDALFQEMTITEFKEHYPVLKNYSVNKIGIALKKAGINADLTRKDGKVQRLAMLPLPKIIPVEMP